MPNLEEAIQVIEADDNFLLLKRIPSKERFCSKPDISEKTFKGAILDLETCGPNAFKDPIIEIGLITYEYDDKGHIYQIIDEYEAFQDPGRAIPEEIQGITGISQEDVKGQAIDWGRVKSLLDDVSLIVCHYSEFDRNALERQAPPEVKQLVESMAFGCTCKDINWRGHGIESPKLDYINFKLGYFYNAHRALTDCFATLNPLVVRSELHQELLQNVKQVEVLLPAINAPYDKRGVLKDRRYRWSDGSGGLPKAWWTVVPEAALKNELAWLDEHVYDKPGAASLIPTKRISAQIRYSQRAMDLKG